MTIRAKIVLFFIIQAFFLVALFAALWCLLDNAHHLSDLQYQRYRSRLLADELRQSSDDLTRMARTYVATGDKRYFDYFKEISAIRDGQSPRPVGYQDIFWDYVSASHSYQQGGGKKASIDYLIKEMSFTAEELDSLTKAKSHSDKLMQIEKNAFAVFQGPRLKPSESGDSDKSSRKDLALKILYSDEYHQAKAEIMSDIDNVFKLLDIRTLEAVRKGKTAQQFPLLLALILSSVLLGMNVVFFGLFKKDFTDRLTRVADWAKQVGDGFYSFESVDFKNDEIGILSRTFVEMADHVSEHIIALEHASSTDPLTQLNNRIALDQALYDEKYKFERYGTPCTVILVDIDHFKAINDQHGHLVGDRILVSVAELLSNTTRESDTVGRWGGEEFMAICPETDTNGGKVLADLIRQRIDENLFEEAIHVTASFGVSEFTKGELIETAVKGADAALYQAKDNGRNRVCIHESHGS